MEAGASPNATGPDGLPAVMAAVLSDSAASRSIAEALIASGADVNVSSPSGETVLHAAMKAGHKALVLQLLEAGADPLAQDNRGRTVLSWACDNGYADMVQTLLRLREYDLSQPVVYESAGRKETRPVLFTAVGHGHADVAEALLKGGANAAQHNIGGITPLHLALSSEDLEMVTLLLSHGADPNTAPTAKGWTPLHICVLRRNAKAMELLLDAGCDLNAPGLNQGTSTRKPNRQSQTLGRGFLPMVFYPHTPSLRCHSAALCGHGAVREYGAAVVRGWGRCQQCRPQQPDTAGPRTAHSDTQRGHRPAAI
eukprot:m.368027 g.368027  ORF g.368027 m.368027 type:complete len:311 (-) comp19976_c0_seq1:2591-3523(-)